MPAFAAQPGGYGSRRAQPLRLRSGQARMAVLQGWQNGGARASLTPSPKLKEYLGNNFPTT